MAVIQSLLTIIEQLPIKQTRSPISIVKEGSNLKLEAEWNFGWGGSGRGRRGDCLGDLFKLFEPQFGHSATESVPPTIPHSEQSKMADILEEARYQ